MKKTKIMVSGVNLDLVKKFGTDPCGFCQIGEVSNAILCVGCLCWRNATTYRIPSALTLASGASDAREQHHLP